MVSQALQTLIAARRVANYAMELGLEVAWQETRPVYDHMGAVLADSVLQSGLSYNSVVRPRINNIFNKYPDYTHTSMLVDLVQHGEVSTFMNWTHEEKISRFEELVIFLKDASVETVGELKECFASENFISSLRSVRGVGPKTVDYMGCLVGVDSVAVDRHVKSFAKRVGIVEDDYDFLKEVFCYAADLSAVSRREFDAWVWHRESSMSVAQMAFSF